MLPNILCGASRSPGEEFARGWVPENTHTQRGKVPPLFLQSRCNPPNYRVAIVHLVARCAARRRQAITCLKYAARIHDKGIVGKHCDVKAVPERNHLDCDGVTGGR